MKSAGNARSNGLYRHIRTSKEIIRNLLNDLQKNKIASQEEWEFILLPLTELTKKVSRLELRILKIRLSGCRFNIPYDLELLDIKSQYARIIENIIRILS